jgi:hypothetical protein
MQLKANSRLDADILRARIWLKFYYDSIMYGTKYASKELRR